VAAAGPWPFADGPNCAVFTLKRILRGESHILLVVHDTDGDWQFLDGGECSEQDAAIVSLAEMVKLDPALSELATLPTGARAERLSPSEPWRVSREH